MKKIKYLGFTLFAFIFLISNIKAINILDQSVRVLSNTTDTYRIITQDVNGTQTCSSTSAAIVTITDEGVMTPVSDGITTVSCSDDRNTVPITVLVNINGTYTAAATAKLASMTELVLPFTLSFGNKTFEQSFGTYKYGNEIIFETLYAQIGIAGVGIDAQNSTITNTNITFRSTVSVSVPGHGGVQLYTANKTLPLSYAETIETESVAITNAVANIKPKYYAYLNEAYADLFESDSEEVQDIMLNASDIKKDINNNSVFYQMDARYGDSSPESPMFGGILKLGINDKLYDAVEIEVYKAIKIPKVKEGTELTAAVKKYFEDNLIGSNEKVVIEYMEPMGPDEEGYYQATISPKETSSATGFLINLLFPRLNAAGEKVLAFSVVQTDEVINTNPKTNDNIYLYVILGTIAIIGAIVLIIKKKK